MRFTVNIKPGYIHLAIFLGIIYFAAYKWAMLVNSDGGRNYRCYGAITAIGNALGLPNYDGSKRHKLQQNLAIVHFTEEELNSRGCKNALPWHKKNFRESCVYNSEGLAPGFYNGQRCPPLYQPLWRCLYVTNSAGMEEDLAYKYCGLWKHDDCFAFNVHIKALDYPEVIKAIIKAAEQPCKFIPLESQYTGNESELHCQDRKGKVREKIIINFYDENMKDKFHIITERKE